MTKRVTIACVVAIAVLQAAAPARATIGSIISSFPIGRYHGIYREGNYVYISENVNNYNYLRIYTLTGTYLRRVRLINGNVYSLRSGSRTHLGAGYVALGDTNDRAIKVFRLSGGNPVTSYPVITPQNIFWDGDYYYVNRWGDKGGFRRYTRTGANAGTWNCVGWPATMLECHGAEYARRGNYGEGPYFVASPGQGSKPCCITTFPAGSLVSTWTVTNGQVWHLAYGDSSKPSTYGAAIWGIQYSPYYIIEFDIDARGASAVMPASLGKVKAIYR